MNSKKLFSFLFGIILLIVVYNIVLPYFTTQTSSGMRMGMGMHGGEGVRNYNLYNYNLIPNFIIILFLVLIGFILLNKILFSSNQYRCKNCGLPIENDQWKICPRCGHQVQEKGGNKS